MGYMLQSLPAVSHLIIGPEDITVYLPALSCTKASTCLLAGLPVPWCICGHFQGVGVLSWKCETVSWQADQACWRAWQRGGSMHCLTRCAYRCVCVCLCVFQGGKRRQGEGEKKTVKGSRNEMTDFSVSLFRHQDDGWASMMMNHDGSTQGPVAAWGCAHLSWVKGGETASGCKSTPRWREETWGICLFISSHMLYPLQCYSESAQWGIRWMLHQLFDDRQAFLQREQLTQTSSVERDLLEGFGREQSCFGIWLEVSGLVLLYLSPVRCSLHSAEPRLQNRSHNVPKWFYLTEF